MTPESAESRVLTGPVLPTFFYFVVPSIVGLLAITTANIVDGIFVGNFVSAHALAAINLMIPYFTLMFGIALMLAIGGSVRAGKYIGEGNKAAASAIFSKTLIAVTLFSGLIIALSLNFEGAIFAMLGAPESLHELMQPYFRIVVVVMAVQLLTLVLYYFVRVDGLPVLATTALVIGALANILLDALFIVHFGWGLAGAAWATGVAQVLQLSVLATYFLKPARTLTFSFIQRQWREIAQSAFNGVSEFINEISGGLIMLILNWILVRKIGVDGVAAFTVVNYLIFLSLMMFYGIADAMHLLISQNFGARQHLRIRQFMHTAAFIILGLSGLLILLLLVWSEGLADVFLEGSAAVAIGLADEFVRLMWPLFLVNGLNVLLSVYLTAMHQPVPSSLVAFSRSLILPTLLLLSLSAWLPGNLFLMALPLAEWLTFGLALYLYFRYSPQRLLSVAKA